MDPGAKQLPANPVDFHLHSGNGQRQDPRDFVARQFVLDPQYERGAVGFRQGLQEFPDPVQRQAPFRPRRRAGRRIGKPFGQRCPAFRFSASLQERIAGDGEEVGLQGFGADGIPLGPGADERLGGDVLRLGAFAGQPEGKTVHVGRIGRVDIREIRHRVPAYILCIRCEKVTLLRTHRFAAWNPSVDPHLL
jgi:hypothetical protein